MAAAGWSSGFPLTTATSPCVTVFPERRILRGGQQDCFPLTREHAGTSRRQASSRSYGELSACDDIDVLCVGAASYDFVFRVDHHPEPDEKITADAFVRCGGGPAANASVMVSRMGLKAAFAGYLGDPICSAGSISKNCRRRGSTRSWSSGEKYPTPVSGVIVKPSGERSLVNYRAADTVLHPGCIDFSDIHPRVILFDGHEPELSLALLDEARAKGDKTVLDAGSLNRGTALLFDKVDYLGLLGEVCL